MTAIQNAHLGIPVYSGRLITGVLMMLRLILAIAGDFPTQTPPPASHLWQAVGMDAQNP